MERGSVHALAPDTVAPEDFRAGGILSGDEGLEWAEAAFDELARSLPNVVVVGLEALAERSDPFLDRTEHERSRNRAWFFGEEIYWRHLPGQEDDWSISDVLAGTRGYALNAVSIVTERPSGVEADLERDQLRLMAERTRLIAVEIFDGEGFALWKPA